MTRTFAISTTWPRRSKTATSSASFPPWPGADMAKQSDHEADREEVPEGAAVVPLIPESAGVHPLFLAVFHALVFLEGSSEEVLDPDASDEALHYLATYLQRLSGDDLGNLKENLKRLT